MRRAAGWLVAAIAAGGVLAALGGGAGAQQGEGLFIPPVWDGDAMTDLVDTQAGGEAPGGEERDGEAGDGVLEPGVEVAEDVVPVAAEDALSDVVEPEGVEDPPPPGDAGISAGVADVPVGAEEAGSSSLLGYLGDRKEAPQPVAPAPGLGGAAAALFGCPRSVMEDLLRAATAKADVVSSLQIEREVLTLCAERQVLVVSILEAEADLARLWRESRGPAPEVVRPEPADVLAQLTEFQGEPVVEFVEEPVEPEPEPEPEPELPSYGWFSIFGTAGDLQAGVSDGREIWFVRETDVLPGGVVVDWIGVSPPAVHVMVGDEDLTLPFRRMDGGEG